MSQSEHQPAPSSSVYQYLLSCPWPLVLGTQSSASDICINLTPPKFAGIWPVFTATLLSPFPSLITFTAWREVGIKPCLAGIDPEYVPFLTFSSRRMGQNQLFENIKYSVTTWHNIFTNSTSLIIYKTQFWRLKNQSCDLNELSLDAGINFYFSLVNLICVINFIIKVYTHQCGTLLNFWNKGLSV